jgi:hypothetical protein
MEEGKFIDVKLKKKFEKSNNFNRYYVTGAIGGFRNPYDFRLSFYNVNSNEFIIETQKLKEQNLSREAVAKIMEEMAMPHEIQCELIMTEQTVKELYSYLGKELL